MSEVGQTTENETNLTAAKTQEAETSRLEVGISVSSARQASTEDRAKIHLERAQSGKNFLNGEIAKPENLPPIVYHVSPYIEAINLSKKIMIPRSGSAKGIGGSFDTNLKISFTEKESIAEEIKDNLKDLIRSAKKEISTQNLMEIANRDESKYGLSVDALKKAVTASIDYHSQRLQEVPEEDAMCDTLLFYFDERDKLRGTTSPPIYGSVETWKQLDPEKVGILAVPSENLFRSGALVRYNLTPENKSALAEVVVHGDVPLS